MDERLAAAVAEGAAAGEAFTLARALSAHSGLQGSTLSKRSGSSVEFMNHRDYQPGDDLRHIDWAVYGRTDHLIVKTYQEEITPHLDIVLDGSRSMFFDEGAKAQTSVWLSALVAVAAANAGFTHNIWIARDACRPVRNGSAPPTAWDDLVFDGEISPLEALQRSSVRWRRFGLRLFISDLLWMGEPLHFMRLLGEGAANTIVVQITSRADENPELQGNVRLVDSESGDEEELLITPAALRSYLDALRRHRANWHEGARRAGVRFVHLPAEETRRRFDPTELARAGLLDVA